MASEMRSTRSSPTARSREPDQQSLTDSSEMHKAGRSVSASLATEYVKICESPEDPERTPDIPEDLEHALLSRKAPHQDAKGPGKSRTHMVACVCGAAVLTGALAAALVTTPQRGGGVAHYLQDQVRDAVHENVVQPSGGTKRGSPRGAGNEDRGLSGPPGALRDTGSIGGILESEEEAARLAGRLPPFERNGEFCNTSAPIPEATFRTWDLSDTWKRVCEMKNAKDRYPYERNWCWVGMNQMCHWNLKSHYSWSTFQDMAATTGSCPPREDQPFDPIADPRLCDRPSHGAIRNWTLEERRRARRWFKDNVAVYVVSLPGLGDRRWANISKRLQELEIWATRVPGVDMRVSGALDAAKGQGFVLQDFNFTRAQKTAYRKRQDMGSILGTVGCAAAHFKAQTKAMADGGPLAIIMEDDSWPTVDFVPRLWSLVREELPCDWEVTALLSRCGYGRCVSPHLMRVMPDANEPAWRCHQGSNWGMHAVLYNVRRLPKLQPLWKRTVFNEERPHCMDIDVALASISDVASFYAVPAVQNPGFVKEVNHRSARWDINQAAISTTTSTSTTTDFFVPTLKPGEPWPGAWNFG